MSNPELSPLPVISAHCADRRDRGYLAWVAFANEVATLLLDTPPIDASPHALEIYIEGYDAPLVVIAEPLGEPTVEGFPLRLRPLDERHAAELQRELFGASGTAAPPMRERMPSASFGMRAGSEPPPMSTRHREALSKATGPTPSSRGRRRPGALTGHLLGDGRFALESLIGAGANGEVYRATHTALRRPIAVKVLHPALQQSQDYCTRFYSEALAASQLDHRNVLRILDYGQEPDGLLYIVMELLEGKSLQAILEDAGPLPLERIVHLISQACAGLAHAHDAGVIHRDIKPENIVVVERRDDEGNEVEIVKVCDFGIADWPSDAHEDVGEDDHTLVNRPDSSKVVGTPAYMAPEQIQNYPVDARTDIYSLGIVLYELATGSVPFPSERPLEVLAHQINMKPTRPSVVHPGVDAELERVIMSALEKSPEKRPPHARALRAMLRELVDDGSNQAASGQFRKVSIRNMLSAQDFLERPADALGQLTTTADTNARGVGIHSVSEAIGLAIGASNPKLAKDLAAWLRARASDPGIRGEEREQIERALHVLKDPAVTKVLANDILAGKYERLDDVTALLHAAGPMAASALVEVRRASGATLELRSRFVGAMRTIGPGALPIIANSLEPLIPLASRGEDALAEDLLRSAPEIRSDSAGEIVIRFVRLDKPAIGSAAVSLIAALWGRRSQPLLLGVLDSQSTTMRLASISALRKLGAIDDLAIERLARIIVGQGAAEEDLQVAAADALGSASEESRPRAIMFLHSRLVPTPSLMQQVRSMLGARDAGPVTVALARSLMTLDAAAARELLPRLGSARQELKPALDTILAQR